MSLFHRDKTEARRDRGVLLLLLHIGSKWGWDSGNGAGNSRSVQLLFLPPLLFHCHLSRSTCGKYQARLCPCSTSQPCALHVGHGLSIAPLPPSLRGGSLL